LQLRRRHDDRSFPPPSSGSSLRPRTDGVPLRQKLCGSVIGGSPTHAARGWRVVHFLDPDRRKTIAFRVGATKTAPCAPRVV
jgi:hypothetical protein